MVFYVCRYTPIEIFKGFGVETRPLDQMPANFDQADKVAHANMCGYGRSVIEAVMEDKVEELVLVNCCDCMRRVYDIVKKSGKCKYLYLLDLPHEDQECEKVSFARGIKRLIDSYAAYSGREFDVDKFISSFHVHDYEAKDYVAMLGVRVSPELQKVIAESVKMPIKNETCLGNRNLLADQEHMRRLIGEETPYKNIDALEMLYSEMLLDQTPCARMNTSTRRNRMYADDHMKGIIYHTIKFCDFYGFEYAQIKNAVSVPILKIETDYTAQSMGQLKTRIEAFAETLGVSGQLESGDSEGTFEQMIETRKNQVMSISNGEYYVAGIDSGSTSTDVVILNQEGKMVSSIIIPTGGGAAISAEKSLEQALAKAGLERNQILRIITTGYGRDYITDGDQSITEITCHAKGAHYLNPAVRTIIDIGGQDSKAIRIDDKGAVVNFLMNDKCAAGTGRFLDMMARTLGVTLDNMSTMGLHAKEDITISSMCTVFAESEVVSLVAQNKALPDIIHGLNKSVASKVGSLVSRLGKEGEYMMTGGVARNEGIVKALEEKLEVPIYVCDEAQICGALGAALFALEGVK